MDDAKCFELAVLLAAPHVAALNKTDRGASVPYDTQVVQIIERYYKIVREARKIL